MNFTSIAELFSDDHSRRLRCSTVQMNADLYFPGEPNGVRKAQRCLDQLVKEKLAVCKQFVVSYPLPEITKPLLIIDPDSPVDVDAGALSYVAISRFNRTRPGTATLYAASALARRISGGPELKKEFPIRFDQADHDIIVSKACVLMKHQRPEAWKLLRNEDVYQKLYALRRDKIPDALVCGPNYESPSLVLDSISRYTKSGIESLITRWIEDPPEGFEPTLLELY